MERSKGKILVIEDDPASYKLIEATLKSSEVDLLHAKNGMQAIEHFNSNADIQLILLDIQLPGMNGYEVLTHIRKVNPTLPIIAQTAYSMTNDREKCLNAGCNEYISKPISIIKLRELVGKYIS
jgi:two-component system, cell cycle response regulator DivK